MRPIGAPPQPKGPPPWLIFKLATTFHPEIRRRLKRAAQVWEGKLWREAGRNWDTVESDHRRALLALQRVDREGATGEQLSAHLRDVLRLGERVLCDHFTSSVPSADSRRR